MSLAITILVIAIFLVSFLALNSGDPTDNKPKKKSKNRRKK